MSVGSAELVLIQAWCLDVMCTPGSGLAVAID